MPVPLHLRSDAELDSLPIGILSGLGCRRPIRLFDHATGRSVHVRCGARTWTDCPACTRLTWGDRSAMLREGLATATGRVAFLTLTGPGFGATHRAVESHSSEASKLVRAQRRTPPCPCGSRHGELSPLIGCPVDPATYGYLPTALFNSRVGALWTKTLADIRRALLGRGGGDLPAVRVVELQRRGLAHVHAVLLLGDRSLPVDALRGTCAASTVRDDKNNVYRWGAQIDVALIDTGRPAWATEQKTLSRYLSKLATYAVKDRFPRSVPDDRHADELAVRRHFETRLTAAARRIRGLSARGRAQYGITAQTMRASSSWPAATLAERRHARAAYGRALAYAEGRFTEPVEWRETALPRFEFKGQRFFDTVGELVQFYATDRH